MLVRLTNTHQLVTVLFFVRSASAACNVIFLISVTEKSFCLVDFDSDANTVRYVLF